MSKHILVYGDSNSWGYLDDGSGHRFAGRWPVSMAARLLADGYDVTLTEECLPGRTTNLDDPQEGPEFNGATPLRAILLSHQPVDHVLIMLGTNDLKRRFSRSAEDIVAAQTGLAEMAASTPCGKGGWAASRMPTVTLICPPHLGARADEDDWERVAEWRGGRAQSLAMPPLLITATTAAGIDFIDGNEYAASSSRDPIHWDADTHLRFGTGIAAHMAGRL
ncbi:MAG: GDSL-type esterase/lipase family protein [Alphaproteobacteria bacterium]|nr:GDSL-type esterase/lipase family protein [Alphaproteobacteria bacterium]